MCTLTNTEKLFKHIHQNISGSYLWVGKLWTNFTFFFLMLPYHNFLQAHITSIFIYICVSMYAHVYLFLFLILKTGT